jgi:hypothetical protein
LVLLVTTILPPLALHRLASHIGEEDDDENDDEHMIEYIPLTRVWSQWEDEDLLSSKAKGIK